MRKIKAVIFDMDGVLIDSEPFHYAIEKTQFELNNIHISEAEHKEFLGLSSEEMWKRLANKKTLQKPLEYYINQNKELSIKWFSEMYKIDSMPGVRELLKRLKNDSYSLAVASSSYPEIIEILLLKSDLLNFFDQIISSEEAGRSKPFPDVYILAAKKLNIQVEYCLAIEDSENGIKAAKDANIIVAAFSPNSKEKQKVADFTISDFSQIMDIINLA